MITFEEKEEILDYLQYNINLLKEKIQNKFFIKLITKDIKKKYDLNLFKQFIEKESFILLKEY